MVSQNIIDFVLIFLGEVSTDRADSFLVVRSLWSETANVESSDFPSLLKKKVRDSCSKSRTVFFLVAMSLVKTSPVLSVKVLISLFSVSRTPSLSVLIMFLVT